MPLQRISEIGWPESMVCLRGMTQRIEERIHAERLKQRKQSVFLRKFSDLRIESLNFILREFDRLWNNGRQQISRKEYEKLEDLAEQWRSNAAKLINAKRHLRESKLRLAKQEQALADIRKQAATNAAQSSDTDLAYLKGVNDGMKKALDQITGKTPQQK